MSYRADRSVVGRRLTPGTTRRVVAFGRPYKLQIAALLALIVVDSCW
jgi:ATP-binding cassette subfamily B protein